MTRLSLLVPGLLGPMPELAQSPEAPAPCHALQRWLARARLQHTGQPDYVAQLTALFGVAGNLSLAELSAGVDEVDMSSGHILRADPVHFRADLDHALLFAGEQLALAGAEARALIEHFNAHFASDDLQLISTHAQRWYLKSSQPFKVQTVPVHQAMGRNVQPLLPRGEDEIRWRKILNEAQMLFFTHPINTRREAEGRLTVNSLWLWGGGETVDHTSGKFDWVMADEIFAQGLARATHTSRLALNTDIQRLSKQGGNGLVVVDHAFLPMASGDLPAWLDALQAICADWIQPLHAALKNRTLANINLYTGDGRCYQINARNLLKFWRRPQPLENYINNHA